MLVGGTGDLGGRIARRLAARAVPFRALVRPGTDASPLEALRAEVVRGDLRDRVSLHAAAGGVSTANAIGRALSGAPLSIADVDGPAEAAGVQRFVFVSAAGSEERPAAASALDRAKLAAEARLRRSDMLAVIVRPEAFMDLWFAPTAGFDWPRGNVVIYGNGNTPTAFVAADDVAELTVRVALADGSAGRRRVLRTSVRSSAALVEAGIDPLPFAAFAVRTVDAAAP